MWRDESSEQERVLRAVEDARRTPGEYIDRVRMTQQGL